jgi:ABC-type microcin C transport system permease subunit YejB
MTIEKLRKTYGVSRDFHNTTYVMLKNYLDFGLMRSQYMTDEELSYINGEIKDFELSCVTDDNQFTSVTCVMYKR